jgi:hypothetical protein
LKLRHICATGGAYGLVKHELQYDYFIDRRLTFYF